MVDICPAVSVIVAAKGNCLYIKACLEALMHQDYSLYDIIVVDDGISVETQTIVQSFTKVNLVPNQGEGPSAARTTGALISHSDYIAFTDSDCIAEPNWLHELVRGVSTFPSAVSCGGRQICPNDAPLFQHRVCAVIEKTGFITEYVKRGNDNNIRIVKHNPSCTVLYDRKVYLEQGGFLDGLWPGEDVEFDFRLCKSGYKLVYNPAAVVSHYRVSTIHSFFRMMYRYGWAQGVLVRQHGVFRRIHLLPFILVAGIIGGILIPWVILAASVGLLILLKGAIDLFLLSTSGAVIWLGGYLIGFVNPKLRRNSHGCATR